MKRIIRIAALLLLAGIPAACVTTARTEVVASSGSECVVLLHGLNRSWRAMRPMAKALQSAGFTTANVDYPSQSGPIEEIAPLAVDIGVNECRSTGATKVHFVTHSLGGILLRYRHEQAPIPDLGRVVMLGPPNHGSEIIDKTRDWPGFEMLAGDAGQQLGTDALSMPSQLGPVDFELGVIAGTGTINVLASAMLPNPDDGKVSVASTRIEGMDDFLLVGIRITTSRAATSLSETRRTFSRPARSWLPTRRRRTNNSTRFRRGLPGFGIRRLRGVPVHFSRQVHYAASTIHNPIEPASSAKRSARKVRYRNAYRPASTANMISARWRPCRTLLL